MSNQYQGVMKTESPQGINQLLPLLISPLRCYSQEQINGQSCGGWLFTCGIGDGIFFNIPSVTQAFLIM